MGDQPWDQLPEEPNRWFQRFESYRLMGIGRDLKALYNRERVTVSKKESPQASGTWRKMAELYRWRERAEAWDQFLTAQAAHLAEQERLAVLREGFALDHIRVRSLKNLAMFLEEELGKTQSVWVPDVKQIGRGDSAERVDLVHFNAPLIEQFRGTLADIAAEVGQRQKSQNNLNINLENLNDEQLAAYVAGKDLMEVLAMGGENKK